MREGLRWPRLRHALCCRNAGGAPVTSSGGSGWRAGNRAAGRGRGYARGRRRVHAHCGRKRRARDEQQRADVTCECAGTGASSG